MLLECLYEVCMYVCVGVCTLTTCLDANDTVCVTRTRIFFDRVYVFHSYMHVYARVHQGTRYHGLQMATQVYCRCVTRVCVRECVRGRETERERERERERGRESERKKERERECVCVCACFCIIGMHLQIKAPCAGLICMQGSCGGI